MAQGYVQLSLFDLVPDAPPAAPSASSAPLDLTALLKRKYSLDQAKVLMAGFTLVKYRREKKEILKTCKNPLLGWYLVLVSQTYARAERQLKDELGKPECIETTEDGKIPMHGQNSKRLYEVGFDFYRKEVFRIKHGRKNWANWFKGSPDEVNTRWKWLMEDDEALEG